jgi:ribonuclease HI
LGTNNVGEFLALVKGLQIVNETGQFDRVIFFDSQTARSWVRKKKSNTNLVRDEKTEQLYQELEKAEKWLQTINLDDFRMAKWETHLYGEIQADYGRK